MSEQRELVDRHLEELHEKLKTGIYDMENYAKLNVHEVDIDAYERTLKEKASELKASLNEGVEQLENAVLTFRSPTQEYNVLLSETTKTLQTTRNFNTENQMASNECYSLGCIDRFFDGVDEEKHSCPPTFLNEKWAERSFTGVKEATNPLHSLIDTMSEMISQAMFCTVGLPGMPPDPLTMDEFISIRLYTMTSFHIELNRALRHNDQSYLELWIPYLKLFLTALNKLPSVKKTAVLHGVTKDISDRYSEEDEFYWWGATSCLTKLSILGSEELISKNKLRTIFRIRCIDGKDITPYSMNICGYREILLLPGSHFIVTDKHRSSSGICTIGLQQQPFEIVSRFIAGYKQQSASIHRTIQHSELPTKKNGHQYSSSIYEENMSPSTTTTIFAQPTTFQRYPTLILKLTERTNTIRAAIKHQINEVRQDVLNNHEARFLDTLNGFKKAIYRHVDELEEEVLKARPSINDSNFNRKEYAYIKLLQLAIGIISEMRKWLLTVFEKYKIFIDDLWKTIKSGQNIDTIVCEFEKQMEKYIEEILQPMLRKAENDIKELNP